ncbi:hypothetical protein H7F15_06465 [Pontibacter sp. Tf4]|uniref:hypothetical protein n=1 Tax=Pontibacter sp. Tf4 TaxID=2761620 RepID=UPI001628E171|nr:hypothetical protein [Pontibacter sp. Tf4]MBB6610673.1 hypothetical protein [Pontibacter sp. Tf4]
MKTTILRSWLLLVLGIFLFASCSEDNEVTPKDEFETGEAFQINEYGAKVTVTLELINDIAIEEKGIAWNDYGGPMIDENKQSAGAGDGSFTGILTGLRANTRYYVRSYYISNGKVTYGNEISFTTAESPFKGEWKNGDGTLVFTGSGQGLVFKTVNKPEWAEAVEKGYVTVGTTAYLRNILPQGKRYAAEALWVSADGVQYSTKTTLTFNASGSELQIESYSPFDDSYFTTTLNRK